MLNGGDDVALSMETIRSLAAAAGLEIDDQRLPDVQAYLNELLDHGAQLAQLDLEGVEPDNGDPRQGWEERR